MRWPTAKAHLLRYRGPDDLAIIENTLNDLAPLATSILASAAAVQIGGAIRCLIDSGIVHATRGPIRERWEKIQLKFNMTFPNAVRRDRCDPTSALKVARQALPLVQNWDAVPKDHFLDVDLSPDQTAAIETRIASDGLSESTLFDFDAWSFEQRQADVFALFRHHEITLRVRARAPRPKDGAVWYGGEWRDPSTMRDGVGGQFPYVMVPDLSAYFQGILDGTVDQPVSLYVDIRDRHFSVHTAFRLPADSAKLLAQVKEAAATYAVAGLEGFTRDAR